MIIDILQHSLSAPVQHMLEGVTWRAILFSNYTLVALIFLCLIALWLPIRRLLGGKLISDRFFDILQKRADFVPNHTVDLSQTRALKLPPLWQRHFEHNLQQGQEITKAFTFESKGVRRVSADTLRPFKATTVIRPSSGIVELGKLHRTWLIQLDRPATSHMFAPGQLGWEAGRIRGLRDVLRPSDILDMFERMVVLTVLLAPHHMLPRPPRIGGGLNVPNMDTFADSFPQAKFYGPRLELPYPTDIVEPLLGGTPPEPLPPLQVQLVTPRAVSYSRLVLSQASTKTLIGRVGMLAVLREPEAGPRVLELWAGEWSLCEGEPLLADTALLLERAAVEVRHCS